MNEKKISASHILIMHQDSQSSRSTLSKDDAFQRVNELYKKVIENPISFKDLAIKHSDCSSSSVGGELGSFGRGMMVKEFEEAAFNLKKDEISKPVETDFGFHIIKRDG